MRKIVTARRDADELWTALRSGKIDIYNERLTGFEQLWVSRQVIRLDEDGVHVLDDYCADLVSPAEAAAASSRGRIALSGGRSGDGLLSDVVVEFGLEGKSPGRLPSLPRPRARHAMAVSGDGSFIVAGGISEDEQNGLFLDREILRLSLDGRQWESIAELPRASASLVCEVVGETLVVIAGDNGTQSEAESPQAPARCSDAVQLLDLSTGEWSVGSPKPTPESGVTSAVFGQKIPVVSSNEDDWGRINDLVEVYDLSTNEWETWPGMPTARTCVPSGMIGGDLVCVNGLARGRNPLAIVERLDTETMEWTCGVLDGIVPSFAGAYVSVDDALYVFGGRR